MAQYPFIFMFFRSGEPFALLTVGGVMKTKLLAVLLLAGSSLFAAPRVVVGIGVGGYVGPAPVVAYAPPAPGPGYAWVGGYRYPVGARYAWHAGYWTRPPYAHAYWVGPRYFGHRYYRGYWRR
jgi:hypothetical protein